MLRDLVAEGGSVDFEPIDAGEVHFGGRAERLDAVEVVGAHDRQDAGRMAEEPGDSDRVGGGALIEIGRASCRERV